MKTSENIQFFAGVRERAYNQAILKDVDWYGIQPEYVYLRDLWLTQEKLTIAGLIGDSTYSTDKCPRVVWCEGLLFLEDGHHRVVKSALMGTAQVPMRIHYVREGVTSYRAKEQTEEPEYCAHGAHVSAPCFSCDL